jgi:hypothetical protein
MIKSSTNKILTGIIPEGALSQQQWCERFIASLTSIYILRPFDPQIVMAWDNKIVLPVLKHQQEENDIVRHIYTHFRNQ